MKKISLLLLALLIVAALAILFLQEKSPTQPVTPAEATPNTEIADELSEEVTRDEADREFLEVMIAHNSTSVTAARAVLQRGGSTKEIRDLAQSIILSRETSISEMRTLYQELYTQPLPSDHDEITLLRDLSTLRGPALDSAFLEDMSNHNLYAISQSHQIANTTKRPEILRHAAAIADTYSNEIVTLKTLLRQMSTDMPS